MRAREIPLASEEATLACGAELAEELSAGGIVYLQGDLGAGKTTLCRGILRGLGHAGKVRSPTYTLMESYPLPGIYVYHFDLYRMNHPEELEFIGGRDYFIGGNLCLVEWPERGEGWLPPPDLVLHIKEDEGARLIRVEWQKA